jgi:peptide-methionine (R)-S-oxide reductase
MMMKTTAVAAILALGLSCSPKPEPPKVAEDSRPAPAAVGTPKPAEPAVEGDQRVKNPLGLSDEDWKKKLTKEQYYVCRQQGTERPGTGALLHYKGDGTFVCSACENPLFESKAKFESGTGWPSFYQPIDKKNAVTEHGDLTHGMTRVEVNCAKCGSHLGHVFDDGPQPTGLRYCMNSVSLKIKEKDAGTK